MAEIIGYGLKIVGGALVIVGLAYLLGCQQSPPISVDKSQRIVFEGPVSFPETVTFTSTSGDSGQTATESTASRAQGVLPLTGAWESSTSTEGQTADQAVTPTAEVDTSLVPGS